MIRNALHLHLLRNRYIQCLTPNYQANGESAKQHQARPATAAVFRCFEFYSSLAVFLLLSYNELAAELSQALFKAGEKVVVEANPKEAI